ncbi:MAG: HAD-IC family P-type ATPase [Rhodospirillales bacterium]|nr:HAD-IC family P-type ATPase [Alphaproteobacteria bacterium]USO04616.1 MAG: HAD-IC family P-type ATPase [Rhodospirillales bacterium]
MQAWHSLPVKNIEEALETSVREGVSAAEAGVRLKRCGANRLTESESVTWYQVFFRQFMNFLILILFIAAVLSFLLDDVIDSLAILAIIFLNGLLGFAQEWKAETALKNLKKMLTLRCRVIREGHVQDIDAGFLVPGDVVLLESGNSVPADLRLFDAVNLKTDESTLTGESMPVDKDIHPVDESKDISERTCMAWTGTHVVNGRGQGVVVATGMNTEFGRIAGLTGKIQETETRLKRQLGALAKQLAFLAIGVAVAIMIVGWFGGRPVLQMFLAGVSLAVAAVPEGLPAVVTITLALGVRIMARRKALLRNLQAAETLGATSVICTDKTGTLTKNEMTIQTLWLASGEVNISGAGYAPEGIFTREGRRIDPLEDRDLKALLETGGKCNHARIVQQDGGWAAIGSPTEAAFIVAAEKAGLKSVDYSRIFCEFSFNSIRKRMSVVEQCAGQDVVHVKGAPEVLLALSTKVLKDGVAQDMTDEMRVEIEAAYTRFAQNGLRTLALAKRNLESSAQPDEVAAESNLVFLGVAGIIDPPRAEVAEAVEKTRSAGIKVIMITGDSPDTALAVGRQIGLKAEKAVAGSELSRLSDEEAMVLLEEDVIFARTVPEDKFRLVQLLQAQGQLVAMTGDGVNDAPALKQADIGIAMGVRGTDVAKGAADIVLSDDNFSSIVQAIEEGRRQYANIKKFVQYLTSSNIGETLAIFLNILMGGPLILLPVQILWINLVTDSVTALSLSVEKAEGNLMREPPRPFNQDILDKRAIARLGLFGSYIGIASLILYEVYATQSYILANTVVFTGIVMMANIHTLNFRSLRSTMPTIGWFSNPWMLLAIAAMIALQISAVYVPFMREVLGTVPLGVEHWVVIILVAVPLFAVTEICKGMKARPG